MPFRHNKVYCQQDSVHRAFLHELNRREVKTSPPTQSSGANVEKSVKKHVQTLGTKWQQYKNFFLRVYLFVNSAMVSSDQLQLHFLADTAQMTHQL